MNERWGAEADITDHETAGRRPGNHRTALGRRSMWTGWLVFASVIMVILGVFNAIAGIVALFRRGYYIVGPDYSLVLNVTGWGWAHLVGGVVVAISGAALFSGTGWARLVAVLCATGTLLTHLMFLSAHPVWSTIVIALCVMVIWAVVVHGEEAPDAPW
ncbi:hypothetical protein ACFWY9_33385 [Amycolatopsis sp. NPDC059027]|uniref:DUF7144 family membrane protein n=1 Tax=Amycolatopsis sp. NPDC059027 TaxID=3346709 RepID=UPI0036725E3C